VLTLIISGVISKVPSYYQIGIAIQLTIGILVSGIFGFSILTHITRSDSRLLKIINNLAPIAVILGQTALMLYFYLRFLSSSLIHQIVSIQIPVNRYEVLIIIILYALSRRNFFQELNTKILIFWALLFFTVVLSIVARELPRTLPLSSDPDIHSFSSHFISNLGLVPWDLGVYGPRDLGYPTGFAVLNVIWMWTTGLNAVNVVTIQTLLQFQILLLAVCSITYVAVVLTGLLKKDFFTLICSIFIQIALIYSVFPYGYQNEFFHNEGTARTASLSISFISLAFSILILFVTDRVKRVLFVVSPITVALLLLMNPAEFLFPGLVFALVTIFTFCLKYNVCCWKSLVIPFLIGLFISISIVISDPFYISFLRTLDIPNNYVHAPHMSDSTNLRALIINFFNSLKVMFNTGEIWNYWDLHFYPKFFQSILIIILLFFPIIYLFVHKNNQITPMIFITISFFVLVNLCGIIIVPVLLTIFPTGALSIITEYFQFSLAKIFLILVIYSISLFSIRFSSQKSFPVILLTIILSGTLPAFLLRNYSPNISYKYRIDYPGLMGSVTQNDLIVIKRLELLSTKLNFEKLSSNPSKPFRILVPNTFNFKPTEQWIFPSGASRILPFYNLLPLAFYYNQGDHHFSIDAYDKNVCANLNLKWLNEHSVKLLYLPTDRRNICIKGLRRLLKSKRLIYKKGRSAIIDLSLYKSAMQI
jgi:hypothetical protein